MRLFFIDILKKNSNEEGILELKTSEQNILKQIEIKKNIFRLNERKQTIQIRRRNRMDEKNIDSLIAAKSDNKSYVNPLYQFYFHYLIFKTWRRYTIEKLQNFEHFSSNSESGIEEDA